MEVITSKWEFKAIGIDLSTVTTSTIAAQPPSEGVSASLFPLWWAQWWAAGECRIIVIAYFCCRRVLGRVWQHQYVTSRCRRWGCVSVALAAGHCRHFLHAIKCHLFMYGRPTFMTKFESIWSGPLTWVFRFFSMELVIWMAHDLVIRCFGALHLQGGYNGYDPTDTWRNNDAMMTSSLRPNDVDDVVWALWRRYYCVLCPLGRGLVCSLVYYNGGHLIAYMLFSMMRRGWFP